MIEGMEKTLAPMDGLGECLTPRAQTVQQTLQYKRARLVAQLADVDAAIAAVEAQPGLMDAVNALRKVGI